MMKIYSECCKNCLLSKDRIVSGRRAKEIIQDCVQNQSHFICHKASLRDEDVMCHTFYEKFGHYSQLLRISERLNMVEFIEQPESVKLITHQEIENSHKNADS